MARLYDPTGGRVLLDGRDIRSYSPEERAKRIGFILQEPFLFTGTVRDNIVYGNDELQRLSDDEIAARLAAKNLDGLLARFEQGLETKVTAGGDGVSLGQKQLIAFMRAVLREPEILVLDEATANIDTVTEQLLEQILRELPASTTKVVIAHRLNTIENADEIFFINGGEITPAGSMEHALETAAARQARELTRAAMAPISSKDSRGERVLPRSGADLDPPTNRSTADVVGARWCLSTRRSARGVDRWPQRDRCCPA